MSGEPNYFVTKDAARAIVSAFGRDAVAAFGGINAVLDEATQWDGFLDVGKGRNGITYVRVGPVGEECLTSLPGPEPMQLRDEKASGVGRRLRYLSDAAYFDYDDPSVPIMVAEAKEDFIAKAQIATDEMRRQVARADSRNDFEAKGEAFRQLSRDLRLSP